jgi:hypothetical protein
MRIFSSAENHPRDPPEDSAQILSRRKDPHRDARHAWRREQSNDLKYKPSDC